MNRISQRQLDRLTPQVKPLLAQMARITAAAGRPAPALVSGLAEGADRHLAQIALGTGYALHALLPFPQDTYEKDFATIDSREQFMTLLQRADKVVELRGRRDVSSQAYRRHGHALLDESDLLLAVWDGRPAQGAGGTAEVVDQACQRRIPVIHVSTEPRAMPMLIWQRQGRGPRGRSACESAPSWPCGPARVASMVSHLMRSAS